MGVRARRQPSPLHPDALVRLSYILANYPVSKSTWYAGLGDRFPRPAVQTGRISMWRLADLEALLHSVSSVADKAPAEARRPEPIHLPDTAGQVLSSSDLAAVPAPTAGVQLADLHGWQARAVAIFVIDVAFARAAERRKYPDGRIERILRQDRAALEAGGEVPSYISNWVAKYVPVVQHSVGPRARSSG